MLFPTLLEFSAYFTNKKRKNKKGKRMFIKLKNARDVAVESASRGYSSIKAYINKKLYLPNGMVSVKYNQKLNGIDIEYLIKTDDDNSYVVSPLFGIDDARYFLRDIDYLLDWEQKYLEHRSCKDF